VDVLLCDSSVVLGLGTYSGLKNVLSAFAKLSYGTGGRSAIKGRTMGPEILSRGKHLLLHSPN